jgi:hypothetical protein
MTQALPVDYVVKAWLAPPKVVTGQRVQLNVLIGVQTYFSEGTSISPPEVDHALVLQTEPAVSGMREIDGIRYTSQLQVLDIYPDKAGIGVVPSFNVSFTRAGTVNGKLVSQRESHNTAPMLILVQTPASMPESGFMVSPEVEVEDAWSLPEGENVFKEGDILQRVITLSAQDMAPMNMPQISPRVPRGVKVIQAEPSLSSVNSRGVNKATIEQHFSYVIQSPGQYVLGGETISWWDPELAGPKDYSFEEKPVDAGGVAWSHVLGLIAGVILLVILLTGWRLVLRKTDPVEKSIKRGIRSMDARDRVASVYAYADYHREAGAGPGVLQTTPGISPASAGQFLSARYASGGTDTAPSRRQTRQLYRHMKKAQKKKHKATVTDA